MNTPTEHDTTAVKTLLDHYRLGEPLTSGRVGWLTNDQKEKLRQLWAMLLAEMETSEPVPVLHSLSHSSSDDTQAEDLSSLSFEPLVPISNGNEAGGPKKPSPWWLTAWASKPAPTPPSEKDDPLRTETVQQRHRSTRAKEDLVPTTFVPIFKEPLHSRSFRSGFWQAATQIGDPDSWVLRFLRARSWDVAKAFDMLKRTVTWRVGQAIDEISFFGESLLHNATMENGLAFACTEDKLGNPVYVIRVRANVARQRNIQAIKRFLCWQIETSQLLATRSDGKVTMLFDFSGFSRENIDVKLV
ncbi:phosphatidylinositol transfer protein csr1, partial [Coemansia sp. RSA 2607]